MMTDLTKAEIHDLCAALLDHACREHRCYPDISTYNMASFLPETLANQYPDLVAKIPGYGTRVLRAAAKAGAIAEVKEHPRWRFLSAGLAKQYAAELGLSDAERAERTAAVVASRFQQNRVQYKDDVRRWVVSARDSMGVSGGLKQALEAGLIVESTATTGFDRTPGLVPADWADTYADLLEQDARREAVIAERHRVMVGQLEGMIGPVHNRGGPVSLDDSQLARLLKVVAGSCCTDCPHTTFTT